MICKWYWCVLLVFQVFYIVTPVIFYTSEKYDFLIHQGRREKTEAGYVTDLLWLVNFNCISISMFISGCFGVATLLDWVLIVRGDGNENITGFSDTKGTSLAAMAYSKQWECIYCLRSVQTTNILSSYIHIQLRLDGTIQSPLIIISI